MTETSEVAIALASGEMCQAKVYRPDGDGPFPGVIVLHDIMGFTRDLERIARRFAEAGYVALTPDMFGPGRKPMCIVRTMRAFSAKEGRPFEVLEQAQSWLGQQDDVDETKVGVVGFCLGGGFALSHAAGSDAAFVGAFYGEVPKDANELSGLPPCFAGYGTKDLMFRGHGKKLQSHLQTLDIPHDFRMYDGVGHSYMNQLEGILGRLGAYTPMRARYDEPAADDSWKAMLTFFGDHLDESVDQI